MEKEKRDDDMAIKKDQPAKPITVSNQTAMKSAKEQFGKYRETFKKLAKN